MQALYSHPIFKKIEIKDKPDPETLQLKLESIYKTENEVLGGVTFEQSVNKNNLLFILF